MKILIYDDNPDFGGHQIMACHGIEALAADPDIEVVCMVNPENEKLHDRLADSTFLTPTNDFKSLGVDLVLCIQGDVAQSTNGIRAAVDAGIECISYLAIPHCLADMGAKLGKLRDSLNQRLINAPNRYITISESMKSLLMARGAKVPVNVVNNGISEPAERNHTPDDSTFTLGLLGRIEFNQKQQEFMVKTFLAHPEVFGQCRMLIAGNGPDAAKLKRLITGHDNITLLPWQNDMDVFYNQIDMLVIPSRFEGVPLVMLEALARGIPVIGSARDGMKDILPEAWTFEPKNSQALADTFSRVLKSWKNDTPALQQKILTEYSLAAFKSGFVKAVRK